MAPTPPQNDRLPPVITRDFQIPHPPAQNQINCIFSYPSFQPKFLSPSLIFTHGAGGTLRSFAMTSFIHGFSTSQPLLCFEGNMNLKSRTKMFDTVIQNRGVCSALGGRSMGARAAILAAKEETKTLVLVSYPLHSGKDVRDEILLEIPEYVRVIFVSGDRDAMCELEKLQEVRKRMRCQTWRVVVLNAGHGMEIKPKVGSKSVSKKVAGVVAGWVSGEDEGAVANSDDGKREGRIWWDGNEAVWSGWGKGGEEFGGLKGGMEEVEDGKENMVPKVKRKSKAGRGDAETKGSIDEDEPVSSRTRKRRKA